MLTGCWWCPLSSSITNEALQAPPGVFSMVGCGGRVYASFKINQSETSVNELNNLHMLAPKNPSWQAPKYPFTPQTCWLC